MQTFGRRVGFTSGILTVLLAGLFLGGFESSIARTAFSDPNQITTDASVHWWPRTDGRFVVWVAYQYGDEANSKVYGMYFADPGKFQLANNNLQQNLPDVAGDLVVWQQGQACQSLYDDPTLTCHRDIVGINLATNKQFVVAASNGQSDESAPAISGNWVVWNSRDKSGAFSLKARDISTMAPAITLAPIKGEPAGRPAIYGKQVLWGELTNRDGLAVDWKLLTSQIGSGVVSQIDNARGDNFVLSYDIRGDLIVYASLTDDNGWFLKVKNQKTGERRVIAGTKEIPAKPYSPTTDGRYVYYSDYQQFYAHSEVVNSLVYDTQTGSYFPIQKDKVKGGYTNLYTGGGYLVWVGADGYNSQIFYDFPYSYLPSTSQPLVPSSLDRYYFPETGHNLANGFKNFWDKNGGLAVFGYSRTEEFDELNPDTGKTYTVQYFERQRYEYHPENAGTPYEVLLGRLGAADAGRRNLLNSPAFQPLTNTGNAECRYFAETKHQACGNFLAYWQSHGLDLGDAGNSYRESLALFGLPISEPYTDPQTGLLTQYFERAKFEYLPENKGTPYEVLLMLLGTQELQNRGWVAGT